MNIIQWLLENGHAKAQRHAENIIVLLKLNELYDLKDYEGIKARVVLYQDWKKFLAEVKNKKKVRDLATWNAIAGLPVPELPMDVEAAIIEGGTILSWGMGEAE